MTHFFNNTCLKGNKLIIGLVLALILLSIISKLPPSIALRDSILCPLSQNTVTIDGRWTNEDEWVDAVEQDMTFYEGAGNCYFKAKHDEMMLYILIDFISDVSPTLKDEAIISIDSNHDSALFPQKDDFRWSLSFWHDSNNPSSSYG